MKGLRIFLGIASVLCAALFVVLIEWAKGMSAFGGGSRHQGFLDLFTEYFPFAAFSLVLLTTLLPRAKELLHLTAFVAGVCLLGSGVLLCFNPDIGFPLTAYFSLWFVYYFGVKDKLDE